MQQNKTPPTVEVFQNNQWFDWHKHKDSTKVYLPWFLGINSEESLRQIWNRWQGELYDLILIEKDLAYFRIILETTDLSPIFAHPRFHIHVGEDWTEWKTLCRKVIPGVMSSNLIRIYHETSWQRLPEYYHTAWNILQDQIRQTKAEFEFTERNGAHIQQNMWQNLPAIMRSIGVHQIQNTWQGKPVVVAAAGPSLDKNIHQLKGMEDRVLIVAVDTALRTFLRHEIHPHMVVATDPTELNLNHFEGLDIPPQTVLAFDPEVYFEIPKRWQHRTLFLNLEKSAYTKWLETAHGPFGYVPKGGSVGNTAFYLARMFGADPIIFTGLDLAFDPRGGKTHTGGSVLTREIAKTEAGASSTTLGEAVHGGARQERILWVDGIHHEKVPTSEAMYIYLRQFTAETAQTNATVIDATEGGARIEGTHVMPLQESLRQFALNGGVNSYWASIQPPQRDSKQIKEQIGLIITNLQQARQTAQQGLELCGKVEALLHLGHALRENEVWLEMDACFQRIYHSEAVKIGMEQALFGAVFRFIHKEKPHEVQARLGKYRHYFQAVLQEIPTFISCLQKVKHQM